MIMETIEIKYLFRPLRRWWWLLLLSTAIAAGSTYWYTSQQPLRYESRTSVIVGGAINDPNPNNTQFSLSQQLASAYADLLNRDVIRQPTMAALGLDWLPSYTAAAIPNTQLLDIQVTDTDPERARAVAEQLTQQLILISPTGGQDQERAEFVNNELNDLQASIEATREEIQAKQAELATLFSARQIQDAQTQIAALQSKLSTLQVNYANLLNTSQEGAINTITVIEPPRPGRPIDNNPRLNILLAAASGLMLAAGGAYLLEYLDDSVKNSDEVERHLGIATLGAIPAASGKEKNDELIMLTSAHSQDAESYRILRTNLQFAAVAHDLNILLVTSSAPNEGKTLITANLALALAQTGRNVVLIDADMHRPRQHKLFKLVNNVGLTTTLLSDSVQTGPSLQRTPSPTLRVMTTGPLPPNPAELLGSQRMYDLLDRLKTETDIILIDSPPASAVADTAVLATLADGVLLVLYTGKTRMEIAKRALAALDQVGARVVGAVLNHMPIRGSGSYYYYSQYNYSRQYYRRDDDIADSAASTMPPSPHSGRSKDGRSGPRAGLSSG